jgi:hypothetical protein
MSIYTLLYVEIRAFNGIKSVHKFLDLSYNYHGQDLQTNQDSSTWFIYFIFVPENLSTVSRFDTGERSEVSRGDCWGSFVYCSW